MEKEMLTMQNIRSDLLHLLRGKVILTVVCAMLAIFAAFGIFLIGKAPGAANGAGGLMRIALMGSFFLIIAIVEGRSVFNLYSALHNPGTIVISRLVNKEEKDYVAGRGLATRLKQIYLLHFFSYGKYVIPSVNYRWSSQHTMTADWVYFHTECDDEFHLVLSKPHTGKILLAYPAKMFDYQPPQV